MLVRRGADVDLKCHGTAPVHLALASAVQPGGEKFALDSLSILLENNANVSVKVWSYVVVLALLCNHVSKFRRSSLLAG